MKKIILFHLLILITHTFSACADEQPKSNDYIDLNNRPTLLAWHNGPKEYLSEYGIDFDLSLTQFYQGQVSSDEGDKSWEYNGKGDLIVNFDGQKLGLWEGFSINLHQEYEYGDDVNTQGDGT